LISRFLKGFIPAALALIALPANAATAPTIDPDSLQADLRFALDTIERQHPDLAHSVKKVDMEVAAEKVRQLLGQPMTQDEAWAAFALLNPILADGHLFIGLPDWRRQGTDAILQGTGFFPFEISLDAEGYPVVVAALGGSATPFAGRRILQIDGQDARIRAAALLARAHGDTPAFRAALVSQRWWLLYWKLYGAPSAYNLVLSGSEEIHRVAAGAALPAILQHEASFERLFECRVDTDGNARLTVAAFFWEDKDQFYRFTSDCFAQMKAASTKHLVIDVSANGGGDDDMWKDGILRYIATRPYKHGSTYVKRERTGEVTEGKIETATQPVADEPLRYFGKVTVLIGPLTYSSAVLFSNVMRDYEFATLTGDGGAARTRQSGGVQSVKLPNSGLVLSYPRFVLDPPSGTHSPTYLQPDGAKQ
jgi:Peptidase family S41